MFDALTTAASNIDAIEHLLLWGLLLIGVSGMITTLAAGILLGFLWHRALR